MTTSQDSALIRIIRDTAQPMEPLPTDREAQLVPLEDIRAVVFDVYGTLIISGAGDISLASESGRSQPMADAIGAAGLKVTGETEDLATRFHETLKAQQTEEQESRSGLKHPEVEIREVWETFLKGLLNENRIEGELSLARTAEVALRYELAVNPVYPMPGLQEVLQSLFDRKIPMGIISNAQFYTPLLFDAFLKQPLEDWGVDLFASVWSYELREGKPSTRLYRRAADQWMSRHRIPPEGVLYIGNDMLNDVLPAGKIGFRTALFAGDRRSLRLREDFPECRSVEPDRIVTSLDQVPGLI